MQTTNNPGASWSERQFAAPNGSALRRKPGPGWSKYDRAPVWEHSSGVRVHTLGVASDAEGNVYDGMVWPEMKRLDLAVRAQGGNRRRGCMVWALSVVAPNAESSDSRA